MIEINVSFREHTHLRRARLSNLWTLDEIVYGEIGSKLNRQHPHDFDDHFKQLYASNISALPNAVKALEKDWELLWATRFVDFEELYSWVEQRIRPITGISDVAIYDISLRIGCNLYPRILPNEYVYIHRKVKDAARVLLGSSAVKGVNRVLASRFSDIFPNYKAIEIEDILCLYSDRILQVKKFELPWLSRIPYPLYKSR